MRTALVDRDPVGLARTILRGIPGLTMGAALRVPPRRFARHHDAWQHRPSEPALHQLSLDACIIHFHGDVQRKPDARRETFHERADAVRRTGHRKGPMQQIAKANALSREKAPDRRRDCPQVLIQEWPDLQCGRRRLVVGNGNVNVPGTSQRLRWPPYPVTTRSRTPGCR